MDDIQAQAFINIAVLDNIIEAQLIDSILTEQNIPHRIRSYHDTAYDGLFQFQMGWGVVYAPLKHLEKILGILNDIRSHHKGMNHQSK